MFGKVLNIYIFIFCLFFSLVFTEPAQAEPVNERAFSLLPKKSLNPNLLGVNAFVNDQRFGTISAQFREVKNALGLKYVRVLFNWNDQVQPSPGSEPFFGFYDEIAASLPSNVQALVVVNGVPSWMENPANWIDNNPRQTFIKLWLEKVVKRYAKNKKIKAWQVWNEPNTSDDPENVLLEISSSPENYIELLGLANNVIRTNTPGKKIVSAATTAINQNYPDTLEYNTALQDEGIESFIDFWAIHIYSMHLENFLRPDNVSSFIQGLGKPIWVTESGEKGTLKQRNYAQQMWPFLFSISPQIKRIYIYQFTEASPAASTYGLRNLTAGSLLSDLYLYLSSLKKRRR